MKRITLITALLMTMTISQAAAQSNSQTAAQGNQQTSAQTAAQSTPNPSSDFIGKHDITLASDLMTPEALWAMGRIGGAKASPDGRSVVYQVGYYSKELNRGHQVLYTIATDGTANTLLTTSAKSESDPAWLCGGSKIAYLCGGQLWLMNADGTGRTQLTNDPDDIEGFLFSPDETQVILIKQLPYHESIKPNPTDLPLATGRRVTDLNYRHWDEYVETIPHPFLATVPAAALNATANNSPLIGVGKDLLDGEPYECPAKPFGGVEQLAWSPDSKTIAYSCRKKTGVSYAISTDTDIFLYDIATAQTRNLCKPEGYIEPAIDPTKTMKDQAVNAPENLCNNPGYDTNPAFSPDGKRIAWLSMPRNGYESDRNRLCVLNLATGEKSYVTETFDSNVDDFCWGDDSQTLYFLGVWHGCENIYQTNLRGEVMQLTDGWYDYGSVQLLPNATSAAQTNATSAAQTNATQGKNGSNKNNSKNGNIKNNSKLPVRLLAERHSMSQGAELYIVTPAKQEKQAAVAQLTFENKHLYDQMTFGTLQEQWCTTTDNKQMHYWVVLPPHFDATKQYPTLLFCEGGPQSPVSQFWSYRWNMQIMAAHGYVVIAPNRHGLPGFGSEWCEQISGDWTGQCMDDYLTAIDDACDRLPFVNRDRLGAVGASFGGFSVYYLAGHHNKRFKCFIAHDGAFTLEAMYTDTEEAWFSNWEYEDAYWNKPLTDNARRTYDRSPHKFVDRWDTPILCIHGEKDYRINANQGFGAFNAARLKGVPAELLIFPDENHWVLKPQNGILWQRTFFNWLDRWLKP